MQNYPWDTLWAFREVSPSHGTDYFLSIISILSIFICHFLSIFIILYYLLFYIYLKYLFIILSITLLFLSVIFLHAAVVIDLLYLDTSRKGCADIFPSLWP